MLAVGNMAETALRAADRLRESGIVPTIVNMRFVKPFDEQLVERLAKQHSVVVTLEDNVYSGGFSERIQAFLQEHGWKGRACIPVCLPDAFIEHGSPEDLYEKYRMDAASVADRIEGIIKK